MADPPGEFYHARPLISPAAPAGGGGDLCPLVRLLLDFALDVRGSLPSMATLDRLLRGL
jgi:hypothetical protein